MILVEAEKAFWFPEVLASGPALQALLLRAQSYAESCNGANRALEIQSYTSFAEIKCDRVCLPYWPIVSVASVMVYPTLGYSDGWGRTCYQENPELVDPANYEVGLSEIEFQGFPTEHLGQAKVEYTAGWDFADTDISSLSQPQITMKAGLSQLLTYMEGPAFHGLIEDRKGGVRVAQAAPPGEFPPGYYKLFAPFRPLFPDL